MKINWCVISYMFNFLGEATLKTLPPNPDGDLFVIHNGKGKSYSEAFDDGGRAAGTFYVPGSAYHGDHLNSILKDRQFPQIVDCDWLVMIDHDLHIIDPEPLMQVIRENTSPEDLERYALIGGENYWNMEGTGSKRHFLTTPLMIINMHHDWGAVPSWRPRQVGEWHFDTGQLIAETLGAERIKCYAPLPADCLYHFSSAWNWMPADAPTKDNDVFEGELRNVIEVLREGAFRPKAAEVPWMKRFFLLREALARLEAEGFKLGAQDDSAPSSVTTPSQ
jgi:hypothetical protein